MAETVRSETHTLWLYRDYWRGLAEMTQANDDIPRSTVFDALGVWYAAAQVTGVRRQLDRDSSVRPSSAHPSATDMLAREPSREG
jgi:hypothetical protein